MPKAKPKKRKYPDPPPMKRKDFDEALRRVLAPPPPDIDRPTRRQKA